MQKHPVKYLVNKDIVSDILLELSDTNKFTYKIFNTNIEDLKEVVYSEIEYEENNPIECNSIDFIDNGFGIIQAKVVHNQCQIVKLNAILSILTKDIYSDYFKNKEKAILELMSNVEFNETILRVKDYIKEDYVNYDVEYHYDGRLEFKLFFNHYDVKYIRKY